jgi:broad specificity phosphatase PhoE
VKKTTTTIIIKKEVKEEIICSPDDSQSSGHESFSYVTPLPSLSTPCSFAELKIPETFIPLLQPDTDFYGSSCSNPDQLLKGLIGSGKYTILLLSRHCKTQSSTFQSQVGTPVVMDMVSFQAMKVATVLLKFSAIFSGPSVRSRESSLAFLHIGHTYKSIPSAANVDIGVLQELDEQNPGELVGENIETTVNNPQIVDAFKDPSLRACSNGETGKEVMERSKKALCYIASLHPGQMIFVPCNRLFAYHTNAALNYLVKCNKITSIDDNKFYTEYFDDYFTKYVNMEHAYTTVYAIRKISDHSNQFAFIPLGNAPEPELLDSIAIYMYSQIFSADSNSPYSNKMAIAEAESILKNVKSKTIK